MEELKEKNEDILANRQVNEPDNVLKQLQNLEDISPSLQDCMTSFQEQVHSKLPQLKSAKPINTVAGTLSYSFNG